MVTRLGRASMVESRRLSRPRRLRSDRTARAWERRTHGGTTWGEREIVASSGGDSVTYWVAPPFWLMPCLWLFGFLLLCSFCSWKAMLLSSWVRGDMKVEAPVDATSRLLFNPPGLHKWMARASLQFVLVVVVVMFSKGRPKGLRSAHLGPCEEHVLDANDVNLPNGGWNGGAELQSILYGWVCMGILNHIAFSISLLPPHSSNNHAR